MNNEKNSNGKNRFIYSFLFIILLVLVTYMYASLASNFGIKNNRSLKPTDNPVTDTDGDNNINDDTGGGETTPSRRSGGGGSSSIPVIVPDDVNWDIRFENININDDSIEAITDAYILDTKTEIAYVISLKEPGETYGFTVDIVNQGSVDAKIYEIISNGLSEADKRYIDYTVSYLDGTEISINDSLASGQRKKIKLDITFKDDIEASDLPSEDKELALTYQLVFVEK